MLLAYSYMISAFVELAINRWKARRETVPPAAAP